MNVVYIVKGAYFRIATVNMCKLFIKLNNVPKLSN